jgi:hypothetical protein
MDFELRAISLVLKVDVGVLLGMPGPAGQAMPKPDGRRLS